MIKTMHKRLNIKVFQTEKIFLFIFLSGIFSSFLNPGTEQYVLTGNSIFKVTGTSSLHDWEMTSRIATSESAIDLSGDSLKDVKSLRVTVPAKSLKSGNTIMDDIAYSSLNADAHPDIEFSLQKINSITAEGNSKVIDATGSLLVAGNKRMVNLKATGEIQGDEICFEGNHSMKMTDHGIKPPTALLGALKTGDSISVYFKVIFKPKRPM